MDKEYISNIQMGKYSKFTVFLILGFFPFLGVLSTLLTFYVFYISFFVDGLTLGRTLSSSLWPLAYAVLNYAVGWVFISSGLAQYRFHKDGLFVKYPYRSEKCISWESFQQICVCYAAYTTVGEPRANTVICCVQKGEKKNGKGRWKTDNLFRYRTVICIDYRPSLVAGLTEVCPLAVEDLRNTPTYRLGH